MNNDRNRLKELKVMRNLHVSGAFVGAILCGYDLAIVATGKNIGETVLYSALGGYMVYFTAKNTLEFSDSLTEIRKIKKNIRK